MELKLGIKWNVNKKLTEEQAKRVLFDCMLKLQELATINAPVDTGRLKTSIKFFPMAPGFSEYILTDGVEYGIHMEYGTIPHYVSAKHLKDWARRVLGDENAAYPVAKKIAEVGVEAHPFFRPALDQVKNIWVKRFMEKNFSK